MTRRRLLAAGLAAASLAAVAGCKGFTTERPQPSRFVAGSADGVIELASVSVLADRKGELRAILGTVFPGGQLQALEGQIVRGLGFDPTTVEGLQSAGLPKSGPVAVRIADRGRGALWIVPVADTEKFSKAFRTLAENRASIDADEQKKVGKHTVRELSTSWGAGTITVATLAMREGFAFVGVGRRATALVLEALDLDPKNSVLQNAEYQALDATLGKAHAARFIVPTATVSAAMLVNRRELGSDLLSQMARSMKSIAWGFDLSKAAIHVRGRVRVHDDALSRVEKILISKTPPPAGVLGVAALDGLLHVNLAGDPVALVAELAPEGSQARAGLEPAIARLNADLGLDVETDILPKLSGHAAVAVGVGDLSRAQDIAALIRNPAMAFWTSAGVGVTGDASEAIGALWPKVDPVLRGRGLIRDTRKIEDVAVTVIGLPDATNPEKVPENRVVLETFDAGNAWLLANTRQRSDKLVSAIHKPPKDPLAGQGGLRAELTFGGLATALRQVDVVKLAGSGVGALTVRAMLAKILNVLDGLDAAILNVRAAPDGLSVELDVKLAERPESS